MLLFVSAAYFSYIRRLTRNLFCLGCVSVHELWLPHRLSIIGKINKSCTFYLTNLTDLRSLLEIFLSWFNLVNFPISRFSWVPFKKLLQTKKAIYFFSNSKNTRGYHRYEKQLACKKTTNKILCTVSGRRLPLKETQFDVQWTKLY